MMAPEDFQRNMMQQSAGLAGATAPRPAPSGQAIMGGMAGAMGGRPAGENVGTAQQGLSAPARTSPQSQGQAVATDPRNYRTPESQGLHINPARNQMLYGGPDPETKNAPVRVRATELDRADYAYGGRSSDSYMQEADQIAQRQALQGQFGMADAARAQQQAAMGQMGQTRGMMEQAALGQAPSLAEAQMQGGIDRGIQAQMAMANSARGGAAARAGAMRQAQMQGADIQAGVANQAAQLRAQEMATARGQLLGADQAQQQALGAIRASDQGQATTNLQAQMQNRAQNDQMMANLYGMGNQAAMTEMQARQALAGTQAQNDMTVQLANANLEAGHQAQQTELNKQLVSGGAGATAGAIAATIPLMFSDRRAKEKVKKADDDIDDLLSKLKAYKYEYTSDAKAKGKEKAPPGKHVSVMAQDLEKSKAGKALIEKHESGYKAVNYAKALPVMLAGLGRLHAKVSSLAEATKED
jgi:hypothetical protein